MMKGNKMQIIQKCRDLRIDLGKRSSSICCDLRISLGKRLPSICKWCTPVIKSIKKTSHAYQLQSLIFIYDSIFPRNHYDEERSPHTESMAYSREYSQPSIPGLGGRGTQTGHGSLNSWFQSCCGSHLPQVHHLHVCVWQWCYRPGQRSWGRGWWSWWCRLS